MLLPFSPTSRNSFLRRNLAANPRGNKTCLGTQLREDMAAREPIRAQKQLHQKKGKSDISNYFPATSLWQILSVRSLYRNSERLNSFLRRNLAASPKGNKAYLQQLKKIWLRESPSEPKSSCIKRREDLIFQTIFLEHLRQILSIRSLDRNRERLFYS
ncbi:hypothetical protein CEXT_294661 [Caerostris extrusa]|uniref:Uncharacterized protein n=1 Tax=Caerostris extrusa TaxID=172846 RepID=A0AAV4P060_CAEEX|nr:hypothetical protein CEXT_294661 [Caerostris extrusa]